MYAIVQASGKQYKLTPGDTFDMNRLQGEPGDTVTLEEVLMVNDNGDLQMGTPTVDGAKVDLEIVEHLRGKKLIVFKMKRRKRYRRKKGHRQDLTRVTVKDITFAGAAKPEDKQPEEVEQA